MIHSLFQMGGIIVMISKKIRYFLVGDILGFSLLEVLLSVVILAIIATTLLKIFSIGYVDIVNMGSNIKAQYVAQQTLETVLSGGNAYNYQEKITCVPSKVTINFSSNTMQMEQPGKLYTVNTGYGNENIQVSVFAPSN